MNKIPLPINPLNIDKIENDHCGNIFLKQGDREIRIKYSQKFGVSCPVCKAHNQWSTAIKVAGHLFGHSKIYLRKCVKCGTEMTESEYIKLDINQQKNRDSWVRASIINAAQKLTQNHEKS